MEKKEINTIQDAPVEALTIQEYINLNGCFYHLTPHSKLQSIKENGLRKGLNGGISVIRSIAPEVLQYLMGEIETGEGQYAIIQLSPKKHGITAEVLCEDTATGDRIAPLQNYIIMDSICITQDDIIDENYAFSSDYLPLDESVIKRLTGYVIPGRPTIDPELEAIGDII